MENEFDEKELSEMLRKVGARIGEEGARDQAAAASSMLLLLGKVGEAHFAEMSPAVRKQFTYDIFKFACYFLAGTPVVQVVLGGVHPDLVPAQRAAAVCKTLGLLFNVDPEPLIETMIGPSLEPATGAVN